MSEQAGPDKAAWQAAHGLSRTAAYTELTLGNDKYAIVSTVVIAAGHGMREGFFRVFETKIFGGPADGGRHAMRTTDSYRNSLPDVLTIHNEMVRRCCG